MQPKRLLISLLVVVLLTFGTLTAFAADDAVPTFDIAVSASSDAAIEGADGVLDVAKDSVVNFSVTADAWRGLAIETISITIKFDTAALDIDADSIEVDENAASKYVTVNSTHIEQGVLYVDLEGYKNVASELVKFSATVINEHGNTDVTVDMYALAVDWSTEVVTTHAVTVGNHAYGEVQTNEPTCLEGGESFRVCTVEGCGKEYVVETFEALGHDDTGAKANCEVGKICAREDCDVELAPKLGHIAANDATCTEAALCGREGCGKELVPALGHDHTGPAADCENAQICLREDCGAELAPKLNHIEGPAATCVDAQLCTREGCGKVLNPALGHAPGEAATCTTNQVCTREACGVELVAALGHKFNVANATCTEAKICSTCKLVEAPALGHNYGEWVLTQEATRRADGVKAKTCANCDDQICEAVLFEGTPGWVILLIVLLCVLVVAGGAFAAYWFLLKDKIAAAGGIVAYWNALVGKKPATESEETTNEETTEAPAEEVTEETAKVTEEATEEKTEE